MRLSRDRSESGPAQEPAELPIDPERRYEPFPLTDLQQAYWVGRSGGFEMGDIASHSYLEFECAGVDLSRAQAAWQKLVERHDALRLVTLPDGKQQILREVPQYEIAVLDLRGKDRQVTHTTLQSIRDELSHQVLPADRWPLFEIRAAHLDGGRVRLFLSFDALIVDAWSLALLLREWNELSTKPDAALPLLELSFRDYVLGEQARKTSANYEEAKEYWRQRVDTLPGSPDLPVRINPSSLKNPRFVRRLASLDRETWQRLKNRAARTSLSAPAILMAAYVEVLSLWSKSPRFTINVPRFNRLPLHPQVNEIAGEFASFTLLEVDQDAAQSFEDRARHLQEQLWHDLNHSDFDGVEVLRELAQHRGTAGGALMPVVFTSLAQNHRTTHAAEQCADANGSAFPGERIFSINQTSQVWLDNHVSEKAGGILCEWDSVDAIFPDGLPRDMLDAYVRFLKGLAEDEASWQEARVFTARRLLPSVQREQRAQVNDVRAPIPEILAHELFARQVGLRGGQTAVLAANRSLTYGELNQLANQIGRQLRERGAKPNSLVAVVMEKGWEQVAAVLGVLHSGAAYLPIDVEIPRDRLWHLLRHGEVRFVLTQSWIERSLEWPNDMERISVDAEDWSRIEGTPLEPAQTPDDLMYVLYTSGSTGLPKGVMIPHRGAVNAIVQTNQHFEIGPKDRVLALTALHHDMSVFDIFGVLGAGGTIVMPQASGRRDPAHWSELMLKHQVTIWNSVPAMMEMMLEFASSRNGTMQGALRLAFLGGDWINITLPDRLKTVAPNARVISVGGPTETTLWNIWYPVQSVLPEWKSIPYGKPIANTTYYVLNEALADCPTWVPGELCCAGVGVAQGYWNDAEKTRAQFVTHPVTGQRIYRTGDLGRYLPDGNIEFLGRRDFQVKIQGQRIELGEIESVLQQHPDIRAALVTAAGDPQGKKRLVAYIVPKDSSASLNGSLRMFLQTKLPEYMIPSAFVTIDKLPLTPNGKINRLALPEPKEIAREAPGTPAQYCKAIVDKIAALAAKVLELEVVDPDANLITCGANSIDMVRIGNQLEKEFGFRPRMDQLFRLQTVSALAKYYQDHQQQMQISPEAVESSGQGDLESLIGSYRVLLDPAEREAFKISQPGLRRGDESRPFIDLTKPELTDELRKQYQERRSHRKFSLKPISLGQFSRFLSCLFEVQFNGKPKYLHASPGGLYPSQIYLHLKPGRVEGLSAGAYYYHPAHHRLVTLTPNVEIDRGIHIPFINTPIFDEAAFSIFVVAQLSAIAPSYGERSIHFVTLEAGLITHLLETSARACDLGLCQIGSVDFERIRPLFHLEKSHVLIHSLLGGMALPNEFSDPGTAERGDVEKAAKILERIKQLSKEEVKALLDAHKALNKRSDLAREK